MLLIVLLDEADDELPHGGVPHGAHLLGQPLEFVVVPLLGGEEPLGLGEDLVPVGAKDAHIRDRGGLAGQHRRCADGLRQVMEELMVASLVVEDEPAQVRECR